VAVSSRSHPDAKTDELLKTLTIKGHTNAGSSLKFCLVAAGEADIYPAPDRPWNGTPRRAMPCWRAAAAR